MSAAPTAPAFLVLGATSDVTECEHCGRTDLRGTIVLQQLDINGDTDGDPVHYGAVCGARAAGTKTAELRRDAARADRAKAEAERIKRQREDDRRHAAVRMTWYGEDCPLGPNICRLGRGRRICLTHP